MRRIPVSLLDYVRLQNIAVTKKAAPLPPIERHLMEASGIEIRNAPPRTKVLLMQNREPHRLDAIGEFIYWGRVTHQWLTSGAIVPLSPFFPSR